MIIKFKKKKYKIYEPIPDKDEVILKVLKIKLIPLLICSKRWTEKYPTLIKKIVFFFLREGPRLTLNKTYAYKLFQKIAEKKLVFVYGQLKGSNQFAVAIGPQVCPYAEYLLFPKELTSIVCEDGNIEQIYRKILAYIKTNKDKADQLLNYSKYSGKPLQLNLDEILKESSEAKFEIGQKELALESIAFENCSCEGKKPKIRNKNKKYDLFIAGAGSYPFSYILPFLRKANINYHTIIDINPIAASIVGEKYGFLYMDTSTERALARLSECEKPLLIIATYHSTHFPIIEKALSINSNTKIFVEKPPVTTDDQLKSLIRLRENPRHFIEIGYNRRYSPFIKRAKEILRQCHEPYTMTCIVKERRLPSSHWYYWPTQGTRIAGNLCHWIDLGVFFIQKKPSSMVVISGSDKNLSEEVSCGIKFEDGSLLTLIASERGNQLRGVQEYIDIRCGDITITIDDFLLMGVLKNGKKRIFRRILRDKGHVRMYRDFLSKIDFNRGPTYPNRDLEISTTLYLSLSRLLLSDRNFMDL